MEEIVGTVASFLGPAVELGKCIVAPIKRQFNYLCCFNSNIHTLRNEAKKLDDAREGMQMQVDTAKNNAEVVVPQVETWLRNANAIKDNMTRIENEISNVQSGCLTIKSRFSLSKRAKKTTEVMKELRDQCKFSTVSQPAPPAAMEPVPIGMTYEFESRKQIEEEIMEILRDEINVIGICGMGGIGKTTMAKRIMKRVMKEHLFDEVMMVVVSQQVDKLRIQLEIAESLGLKLEEETLSARAHKLRARLMRGTKRTLIVLDDVWESLTLDNVGIPSESCFKGCTILITSRNRSVLSAMDVQKVYGLQILLEEEAWFLFREKAGTCVEDLRLLTIAKQVIKECKGLPIALVIVARALKDENNASIWKDALQQLKKSNPEDIPDVIAEVYNPLQLSYDFLDNEHAKYLFLLCCLFPEDYNIPLEYLTLFAMGLRMFEGIKDLEEARNRTCALIKILKSRFLLLDGPDEHHVTMHDVIRDVSIFIASKKRCINCNDCSWISSFVNGRDKFPLGFSNLRLLWIDNDAGEEFQINDDFIEGTRELNVLFITHDLLRSLPQRTQLLINLRTLILYTCPLLETVSVVGDLVSLEILIIRNCKSIEELPLEIGRLNRLRLLELSKCPNLEIVEPGVISSLVGLEELKMVKSFNKWEAEDNEERENARLIELESLSSLTCLEIEIEDFTLAAEQIRLPSKIVKYNITIGSRQGYKFYSKGFEKKMNLHLPKEITLGNWIDECVRSAEFMCLGGDGSNNLDLGQAQNMRSLIMIDCSTVKKLVNITTSSINGRCGTTITVFPLLEFLWLDNLPNLEEICDIEIGPIPEGSSNSFKNLKRLRLQSLPALKHLWKSSYHNVFTLCRNLSSIYLENCDSLRNLFSLSTAKDSFLQLERLKIKFCDMMEQVFSWNDKNIGQSSHITFPKLKKLRLQILPNLTTFYDGLESIEFPLLADMDIFRCQELKSLVSSSRCIRTSHDHDDHSLHLLCEPKVSFGKLKKLRIDGNTNFKNAFCRVVPIDFFIGLEELHISNCNKITSLLSSSMAQNLVNLRKLEIGACDEMVKVIGDDEEEEEEKHTHACTGDGTTCLFPKLQELELLFLPRLEIFCEWRCALKLPSLEEINIASCKMKRFSLGTQTTPNLKTIKVEYESFTISEDLNGVLERLFFLGKR